jgi:hypothetical protein
VTHPSRDELLAVYGRFYGEQHFALVFTDTNRARSPEDTRPKRITQNSWQTTQPLPHAARGEAVLTASGQHRNPAINLRTSGLVGIECDGGLDLADVQALDLPPTLTERTSSPVHLHFYFRAPERDTLPKVGFRFEDGKLKADGNRYFVCAPAIHPNGSVYSFLQGRGPGEIEIATLPEQTYSKLLQAAGAERDEVCTRSGPVNAGDRHDHLRRIAWVMRRYSGASLEAIEQALLTENATRCNPPKEERLVLALARYTVEHWAPKGEKP